jgi:transposase
MKRERKIYDPAFNIKAVELSNERSNITELSRELGIQVSMLYKWRKENSQFGSGSFPGKGVLKQIPEQKTISDLEAKLRDAELERDILKKQ